MPLAPSGKWVVFNVDGECALMRDFGQGKDRINFAIQFLPLALTRNLTVTVPDTNMAVRPAGEVVATLFPAGKTTGSRYRSIRNVKGAGRHIIRFDADTEEWRDFASSATIAIALDGQAPITLKLDNLDAALKPVKLCELDLLKSWGLGPEMLQLSPQFVDRMWLSHKDYPSLAIKRNLQGAVTILWKVDLDGRAKECRIVRSSGHAILDKASCDSLSKRARFRPALNGDGVPTVAWMSGRVQWWLP